MLTLPAIVIPADHFCSKLFDLLFQNLFPGFTFSAMWKITVCFEMYLSYLRDICFHHLPTIVMTNLETKSKPFA